MCESSVVIQYTTPLLTSRSGAICQPLRHNCRCVITLGVDPSQALLRLFHCRFAELQDDVLLDVRKQYDCVVSQQVVDLTHGQNGPLLPCL
jgi:hypothetical protein